MFVVKLLNLVAANSHTGSKPYQCITCRSSYEVQYYICPACGGFSVDRVV